MAFNDVIALLKTQRSPFIYLRFLRWAYTEEKKDGDIVDQYFKDKNEVVDSGRPHPLRSVYRGVYPVVSAGVHRWVSEYYDNEYKRIVIGTFDSEHSAAVAYDKQIREIFDDKDYKHSSLNFNKGVSTSSSEEKDSDEDAVTLLNITSSGKLLYKVLKNGFH